MSEMTPLSTILIAKRSDCIIKAINVTGVMLQQNLTRKIQSNQ